VNVKLPLDLTPITEGLRSISETMRTIRDSVALLPQIAETLAEIQQGVEFMGTEVRTMRRGVDELGVEVKGMRSAVDPMVEHLDAVAERIEALEPRLEDLSLAIHPLRRATGRLGRRRAANGGAELDGDQTSSGENVSHAAGSAEE
jgi:DNA repair ATPase RecN